MLDVSSLLMLKLLSILAASWYPWSQSVMLVDDEF